MKNSEIITRKNLLLLKNKYISLVVLILVMYDLHEKKDRHMVYDLKYYSLISIGLSFYEI